MSDNVRFHKILTLAVNPAAQEGEAQAAFSKLRELVRQNPHLSSPPPPPVMPEPVPIKPEETSTQWLLTKIRPFWFPIIVDNLSGHAYNLGLRCRLACDFSEAPPSVTVTCTGTSDACDKFAQLLRTLTDWINSQPAEP